VSWKLAQKKSLQTGATRIHQALCQNPLLPQNGSMGEKLTGGWGGVAKKKGTAAEKTFLWGGSENPAPTREEGSILESFVGRNRGGKCLTKNGK